MQSSARPAPVSSAPVASASVVPHKCDPTSSRKRKHSKVFPSVEIVTKGETAGVEIEAKGVTAGGIAKKFRATSPPATLSHLIALQVADGYWNLTNELADCMSLSLQKVMAKHP